MFPVILLLIITTLLLVVAIGQTKSVCLEEIIVDVDFANQLQGDDMFGNANPAMSAPNWAQSVEKAAVSVQCNGDALGAEAIIAIISGDCFPDGPHQITIGASGSEDVDIMHAGIEPTVLKDLGMRVKGGKGYTIFYEMVGEDGGEAICNVELVFCADPPRERKQWIAREAQNIAVANVQGADMTQVDATIPCGNSPRIGGIIGATASDGGALGGSNQVLILSSGVKERQEYNLGGFGGELITSEGHVNPPTQRFVNVPLKPNDNIYVEFRMTGEDSGTTSSAASIGLVLED